MALPDLMRKNDLKTSDNVVIASEDEKSKPDRDRSKVLEKLQALFEQMPEEFSAMSEKALLAIIDSEIEKVRKQS
jgi:hypothetical protein